MFKRLLMAAVLAGSSFAVAAADADKAVHEAVQKVFPSAKSPLIAKSELPGFHQVIIDGQVFFVSDDGKYLIHGSVFDIPAKYDLGEKQLAARRKSAIAKIPLDKQLVFAPPHPKYTVTVFTDVDCPYCRQFHKQIAEYNRFGIAVNYVLFPLPMHKGADKKAETVWCSANRNEVYTSAMNGAMDAPKPAATQTVDKQLAAATAGAAQGNNPAGVTIPATTAAPGLGYTPLTCANPVAELTEIGKAMGVDGTPAIFGPDGEHLGGYIPPDKLAERLDQLAQPDRKLSAK